MFLDYLFLILLIDIVIFQLYMVFILKVPCVEFIILKHVYDYLQNTQNVNNNEEKEG